MEHNAQLELRPRHARTLLPATVHSRLSHLSVDLHTSLADLLIQGAILLCRYHDRGGGLPEPMAPRAKDDTSATESREQR
jgi:hypothetical protein